jgi:hypothetical protein
MHNADVLIYKDEKPDAFGADEQPALTIASPVFYTSREIKELEHNFDNVRGSRSAGVLLTETELFIVYNTGGSLMCWDYAAEIKTKSNLRQVLCFNRFPHQYRPINLRAMMLGNEMEQAYQILTSTGGQKRSYFILDNNYESFVYLTNDHNGEVLLKLLCDREKVNELNSILSLNLQDRDPGSIIENDAMDENGEPVMFAYDCDLSRVIRFNQALSVKNIKGTMICFDFQKDVLRRYCSDKVRFQTIDIKKLEGRFFP